MYLKELGQETFKGPDLDRLRTVVMVVNLKEIGRLCEKEELKRGRFATLMVQNLNISGR